MVSSGNVASTANYNDNTYVQQGSSILDLVVANAAVLMQLYLPQQGSGRGSYQWSQDLFITPSVGAKSFPEVGGIRFKSAVVGSPAQVQATLYTPDEALSSNAAPYTQQVTGGGGIVNPPVNALVNFDHNGVLVGQEGTLDLVDATAVGNPAAAPIAWVATDTPGTKVAYVPVFALGVQHNGAGQVNEAVLDFEDQATLPAVTWALTDDAANHRVKVKPTITGVLTQLADSGVLGAPAASIDFQNIPATFMTLRLDYIAVSSSGAGSTGLRLRFNNDSGANYEYDVEEINSGVVTNFALSAGNTFMVISELARSTGASAGEIIVPGYAGTTFQTVARSIGAMSDTGAAADQRVITGMGRWLSAAAVNRVTVFPGSGNFATGSRVVLYGL